MSLKRASSLDGDVSPPPTKRKVSATTTNRAVANFFRPVSEKEPEKIQCHTVRNSLLVARFEGALNMPRSQPVRVAAFDFDDTLITTQSGNRFAKNANDWKWWHASVPARLKQLHEDGFTLLVMSNQAAVNLRPDSKVPKDSMRSLNILKNKISAVLNALGLPISVYAATGWDIFRKPRTGMWEQMIKDYNLAEGGDVGADAVDHHQSFFVGDAAGREGDKAAGVRRDHSCSDRDFAANLSILFHTPEAFFLGEPEKPFVRTFDPGQYIQSETDTRTDQDPLAFVKKNNLDIVLFCGSPGSGKSTFYWQYLQPLGYERINQDILKTRDRCMKAATQFIEDRKSVAVDNTNADIETRQAWLNLALKLKVPMRLVHFTASSRLCEHNDTVRALGGELMNPEKRTLLPKLAFTGFASRYREPQLSEGFQDVKSVHFNFRGTEEQKRVWKRYWIS